MVETKHLNDRVVLRPDEKGGFDELMLYDSMGNCIVHFEMMDRNSLYIGIHPDPTKQSSFSVWIGSGRCNLTVTAEDE